MSHAHLTTAAATFVEIVDNIEPYQLDAPTPCAEYDVRALVNHLLFWGPSLVGAATKETVPPPEKAVDVTQTDWSTALKDHADRMVDAWRDPAAWDGTTHMGGPMELPAALVAGMIVGEFVIHGWDLAQATGQQPVWDADLLTYLRDEVEKTAAKGREYGVYGQPVTVTSSSTLDQIIGLTGRDPHPTTGTGR
jgi:uncharacterized protein (TIGR03086 family)